MHRTNPAIQYHHFDSIDSTQDYTKANLHLSKDGWAVVIAKEQTKGRGQGTNTWTSPPGQNVYVTFSYRWPKSKATLLQYLPQTAIVSVFEVVKGLVPQHPDIKLKWINDLLINGKKVCGVLCESIQDVDELVILIGIGINVDASPAEASTLEKELGIQTKSNEILSTLTSRLIHNTEQLSRDGFGSFQDVITKNLYKLNEQVVIKDYALTQVIGEGVVLGINQDGNIKIRNEHGLIEVHHSGKMI